MTRTGLIQAGRFGLVGGLGFVIDAGLLFIFTSLLGLGPFLWRVVSFLVASVVTWWLHRHYTFQRACATPVRQWGRFVVFNGAGAGLNFAIYSLLLIYGEAPLDKPMVAVTISSALAFVYNFTVSKYVVFSHG